ncbi:TPA: hypothetical protein KMK54_004909 [Escherichia coli]|nr:hypothetical protein [Escherichia coli]
MKYANSLDYTAYDPTNKRALIVGFALDITYFKNGTAIDPTQTDIPLALTGTFSIQTYDYKTPHQTLYELRKQNYQKFNTELRLKVADHVYVTNGEAEIPFSWFIFKGAPYVETMNHKVYMEQIDSNLALTYIKKDGTGTAIVPHSKVSVENKLINGISGNGVIKLKLDSSTDFGTRSSGLRLTVEWQ